MVFFILFSNRKRTPQKKHPAYILMDVLCTVSYSFGYHCLHLIYIYMQVPVAFVLKRLYILFRIHILKDQTLISLPCSSNDFYTVNVHSTIVWTGALLYIYTTMNSHFVFNITQCFFSVSEFVMDTVILFPNTSSLQLC